MEARSAGHLVSLYFFHPITTSAITIATGVHDNYYTLFLVSALLSCGDLSPHLRHSEFQ